jgi:hypothetical protein
MRLLGGRKIVLSEMERKGLTSNILRTKEGLKIPRIHSRKRNTTQETKQ